MRLAICQINPVVGDIDGNSTMIIDAVCEAAEQGADIALLPEQILCGYPADDLWLRKSFLVACRDGLEALAVKLPIPTIVGFPEFAEDVFNSAAVLADGQIAAIYRKQHLPNYGVFDEHRYFRPGDTPSVFKLGDVVIGLTICEDIWQPTGPATDEVLGGAHLVVNLSASPYRLGRGKHRERMVQTRAADNLAYVALCNMVGGQDELVFDGHSVIVDHTGTTVARAPQFASSVMVCDIDVEAVVAARLRDVRHRAVAHDRMGSVAVLAQLPAPKVQAKRITGPLVPAIDEDAELWAALRTGLADYVNKNGFANVLIGVSGGIDSAAVVALAVDALSADRVLAITMPSKFSSPETRADAERLCEIHGVRMLQLDVEPTVQAFIDTLEPVFEGRQIDVTEENLQARVRGTLLMAVSNKFGHLVLTTGNKSETSVGYTTLYGDMAGGFAPLKDVPKTRLYRLVDWLNATRSTEQIPRSIIERPPTAELREGQLDQDTLPPYAELDRLIAGIVEDDRSSHELAQMGFDPEQIERVLGLVRGAEHKRRQAPPGIKIGPRAFGRDWRYPVTNRFRG